MLTKRADIDRHVEAVRNELERETDPNCRMLQEDYLQLIRQLGSREAITRRFFLISEHEPLPGTKRGHEEEEAIASLQTAARTAANYLRQCGNTVLLPENADEATSEILYHILCRQESNERPFSEKVKQVLAEYIGSGRPLDSIPSNEFYAPGKIDFSHGRYICIDGIYYHILDLHEYHVQLFAGKTSELVVENQIRPNLTIWKFDADDGVTPVEGATFLVEYADGHSIAEVTTGPDGSATAENLLPSVVKITEKSVPSPYLLDAEPQLVTLYPNRDRNVYFYNHQAPTITIVKEDSITHERLSDVKMQVFYASNKSSTGEYRDLGVFVTNENGEIVLSRAEHGIEDGWFRIVELEPKTGYAIKGDGVVEGFVQAGKSKTFLVENTPLSALVIWKYDSKTSQPVSATFEVRYLGGTSGTGGTVIGRHTTSPVSGGVTVTGLKAGTYVIEEVSVNDNNYVIDSSPQTVYISGEEQDVIQVWFGNSPKGSLLITKKSTTGEPLRDVEFTVTDSTGAVIGDANGKFWTSSAGEILIEGIDPGTTLVVTETGEKAGYVRDDVPQTAVIRAGQCVTLKFINAKKGNLIIQKYGVSNGKKTPLEGVEFKITYADGKFVDAADGQLSSNGIYFSNSEGQVVLSGIVGTVVVTEVASVPGYTISEETRTQTVTVNANDTQTLYFYNNGIGGLLLTKVSKSDNTKRIPNTTFEIRRAGDDALIDTVTTGGC